MLAHSEHLSVRLLSSNFHQLGLYNESWEECFRLDGQNLAQKWLRSRGDGVGKLAMTANELREIDPDKVDFLLGLFGESHVEYDDRRLPERDPSLAEMTKKAIEVATINDSNTPLLPNKKISPPFFKFTRR